MENGKWKMEMTDVERLIFLMLSEINEKIGIKSNILPDFITTTNLRDKQCPFIESSSNKKNALSITEEVVSILDMWVDIQRSHYSLTNEKREMLEINVPYIGNKPVFSGFDISYEKDYMELTRYLVGEIERFRKLWVSDFVSKTPSLNGYKRMLDVYIPIRDAHPNKLLTLNQLCEILINKNEPLIISNNLINN